MLESNKSDSNCIQNLYLVPNNRSNIVYKDKTVIGILVEYLNSVETEVKDICDI